MSEQQQMSQEEFVNLRKIESLANQNARQSVVIADLEAQVSLLIKQVESFQQEGNEPVAAEAPEPLIEGEIMPDEGKKKVNKH